MYFYPQKLALTSPTGGGRSVGMVRSRTKATEFSLVSFSFMYFYCYVYVFLLLCILCFVYYVFIMPTGILRLL
jgi:hypothetical protein